MNPAHLFLGSAADNTHDAQAKRRLPAGARHGRAKLTPSDVVAIRCLRLVGKTPYAKLGAMFGVSETQARNVAQGRSWR